MNEPRPIPNPASKPTAPPPEPVEDTTSRALTEALRSSFVIVKIIMVLLVVVFFASGIFTVGPQEKAIVLRFGVPVGVGPGQLLGPGLHWSFPYPIDEVVRIPIGGNLTVTSSVGWYATLPDGSPANTGGPLNPASDGYTLTGDMNIIHVKATLRYRINKPVEYALNFVNASNLLQNAVNNAIFRASAEFKVDDALRNDRARFQEKIKAYTRDLVEQQDLGVTLDLAEVQSVPPVQVKDAFNQAFSAEATRAKTINDAQGLASSVLATASSEATNRLNTAYADRIRMVKEVAAEADYFKNQLPVYRKNPQFFVDQMQIAMLGRILTNTPVWTIPRSEGGKKFELWFHFKREPELRTGK